MNFADWCKQYKEPLKNFYKTYMNRECNIDNPQTLTEKIQWLKIYDSTFIKSYCADKITIHDYCIEKLQKDICIPIIKVYNNVNEINYNDLPDKFVIKCNHGSGMNIIVKDKNKLNKEQIKTKLIKWLNTDYTFSLGYELHYKNIPHKILIEEYKENIGNSDLTDYKFYCFNGKPEFCQVITDRHNGEKISHYDMEWNYKPEYDWIEFGSISNLPKPKHYDKMIKYAELLSKDFKLVRIDFYEVNDTIYLGELTFTPMSGFIKYKNKNTDSILGSKLKL